MIDTNRDVCEWIRLAAQLSTIAVVPFYGHYGDVHCPCGALKLSYFATVLSYLLLLTVTPFLYYISIGLEALFVSYLGNHRFIWLIIILMFRFE